MENLSDKMRERLEKWRLNPQVVKNEPLLRKKPHNNYVARSDYGDDALETKIKDSFYR